ncbi:MAG: TonB family protein [Balneolaceae bacterium]|nr:TonB family protein [Balneolaceae bacterium]
MRKYHTLFMEFGLILVLLAFIIAAKVDLRASASDLDLTEEQDLVEMEEIERTEQEKKAPPPERPQLPVEVPDDEIIEDQRYDFSADLDLSEELPPPPSANRKDEEDEPDYFEAVEQMPQPIGGMKAIHDRIRYPREALRADIEGTVHLKFYVNENGEVEDPEVVRGLPGGCNEEALRVIKNTRFTPGMQRGRPVKVLMGQAIHFRIKN